MLWSNFKVNDPAVTVVARRLQETALQAERDLRLALEGQLRAYHALLEDLTHRLGLSDRLDALRHDDPTIPKGWGPIQWRQFMEDALAAARKENGEGWGNTEDQAEIARLQREIADLQAQLRGAQQERVALQEQIRRLQQERSKAFHSGQPAPPALPSAPAEPRPAPPAAHSGEGAVSPVYRLWVNMITQLEIPSRSAVPIAQRDLLPASANQRKRQAQILFTVAVLGLSIRPEIDLLIAQANGLKPRSGSVRRLFDDMLQKGLLEAETLRLKSPTTRLALVRLGEKGRVLAEILFKAAPVEGEWERLNRLHEGKRFPGHTLAVLLFALHARLRGWQAKVMPSLKGNATPPDIAVERDGQRLFVEVELGKKERGAKWKHNAEANGGKVALCTGTAKRRELLVGDCKRQGLHGVATDLESMIAIPWTKISPDTPLWLEEW